MTNRTALGPVNFAFFMITTLYPTFVCADQPAFDPTDRYETRQIEGWKVIINKGLIHDQPELADKTLALLRFQLYQIVRKVPEAAVNDLRKIAIWVEENEKNTPCMAYHPGAGWLRDHGVNPDKAHCVELANARNFLTWTREQPWMVLHEMAHGYHHQFLAKGFENSSLKTAYDHAMTAKTYDSVLRISGKEEKAYATNNPMEYFAEATEAYFGTNDFYPYVKSELQRHDPDLFGLMGKLWRE